MGNICLCKKVSEEEIIKAVKDGAKTFEEVKEATSAGAGCCKGGRCKSKIIEIIENN
ncbi:(2Fe-2S)-binding protein [Clostridium butyricum]|uniref:(2Fe-2S)-binding protein n=1 Tax=Clostridium butyricum TaxID=1492 RepID=UPI002AB2C41B|nr:(2Fe-2S)-binding protein [Clostridium butyricum]